MGPIRELSSLIDDAISPKWQSQPQHLIDLLKQSEDEAFLQEMAAIKYRRKTDLAKFIKTNYKLTVDPHSIFDIQIKRIHSYKRQFMNILHILHLYNKLKAEPKLEMLPRTFIFGGKAAPGYHIAKEDHPADQYRRGAGKWGSVGPQSHESGLY